MRIKLLLFFTCTILLVNCATKSSKSKRINNRNTFFELIETYNPDSTVSYQDSIGGTEKLKYLGTYVDIDSTRISFISIEKSIKFAIGYKNRSYLALINHKQKGIYSLYDCNNSSNLPISLEDNIFKFDCKGVATDGTINIQRELLCIDCDCFNECFILAENKKY